MSVTLSGSIWDQDISIEILEWHKNVGDTLKKGEKLLKVREIRKLNLKNNEKNLKTIYRKPIISRKTIKSPKDGLLLKIFMDTGEIVPAETVLAKIYWFDPLLKK